MFIERNGHNEQASGRKPWSRNKRLASGIAAVALVCALGLFVPTLLGMLQGEAETPIADGNMAEAADAQIPDQSLIAASLSIEMPASRYTMLMSSVPGIPFRAICPGADEISFVTDAGIFLEYGAPDYKVEERGTQIICASGDTVYLAPAAGLNTFAEVYRITVSAFSSGSVIGGAVIIVIHQDGEFVVKNVSVSAYGQ